MSEEIKPKDHFVLYVVALTLVLVGGLVAVKLFENEKYSPIKEQLAEEAKLMNIRVIKDQY